MIIVRVFKVNVISYVHVMFDWHFSQFSFAWFSSLQFSTAFAHHSTLFFFSLRDLETMSSTSVIAGIRACVGSTCEVTTNRGLRLVRTELAKTQTRSTKAELDRLHSDLLLGPVEGSRPLTRSQKRVLPGISVLGGQSAASSSHEPAHRPPPTAPKRRRASTPTPPQPVRVPPSPPHAPPQAVPVDHASHPPVVFDAPASIPHPHGIAETWDLVEERDVDSVQSLRV